MQVNLNGHVDSYTLSEWGKWLSSRLAIATLNSLRKTRLLCAPIEESNMLLQVDISCALIYSQLFTRVGAM